MRIAPQLETMVMRMKFAQGPMEQRREKIGVVREPPNTVV